MKREGMNKLLVYYEIFSFELFQIIHTYMVLRYVKIIAQLSLFYEERWAYRIVMSLSVLSVCLLPCKLLNQ